MRGIWTNMIRADTGIRCLRRLRAPRGAARSVTFRLGRGYGGNRCPSGHENADRPPPLGPAAGPVLAARPLSPFCLADPLAARDPVPCLRHGHGGDACPGGADPLSAGARARTPASLNPAAEGSDCPAPVDETPGLPCPPT